MKRSPTASDDRANWRDSSSGFICELVTRKFATRTHAGLIELSFVGEVLPTEFRLFKEGWNDTEKGAVLFDALAAKSVMEAAAKWNVDFMIDLDHQSITPQAQPDPTARDSRGWFRLELRNGELWAVGVKWTDDGAARLLSKRQRYISPAAAFDPDTKRVTSILNVALVAMPATHDAPALIAASANGECMDPKLLKEAMDALIAGDAEKCMEILKGIITGAAGAESTEELPADPAADPTAEMAATPPPTEEKKEEVMAASARLLVLTGSRTFSGALDEVETWQRSHIKLAARQKELDAQQAAIELGKRRENVDLLIQLGAETHHTSGLAIGKLCDRLLKQPLDEQTAHVNALLSARGTDRARAEIALKPHGTTRERAGNAGDGSKEFKTPLGLVTLSVSELEACSDVGAKPEDYAHNKAIRDKARGTKG